MKRGWEWAIALRLRGTWSETSCEAVFWTNSRGTEVAGNKLALSVFLLLTVFVYPGEAEKSQCQQRAATLLLREMTARTARTRSPQGR